MFKNEKLPKKDWTKAEWYRMLQMFVKKEYLLRKEFNV